MGLGRGGEMTNPSTTTEILAEELPMKMHIDVAGPLLDAGWPMEQVVAAIKACADLIPMLEEDTDLD